MAIFRSLKTLIRNPNRFPQSLINISPSSILPITRRPKSLSPLSLYPFYGPLFLSSPPWKLSQLCTPLFINSDAVLLPILPSLSLPSFPARLWIRISPPSDLGVLDVIRRPEHVEYDDSVHACGGFTRNFFSPPNMISMSRVVAGPVLALMITNEWYLSALLGIGISGATDWLDGYVARKMRINSVIGSYLDPLADKILIGCVALAMVHQNILHPGLVGIVVLRDSCLIVGAFYKRASSLRWQWKSAAEYFNIDGTSSHKVEPLFISKYRQQVNTVLQLTLVAAALLQPEFGTVETQSYITYMSWIVASTTLGSSGAYIWQQSRYKVLH